MMPFEQIEPYDLFFTKERYALRQLEMVGLRNLYYLPMYCVPGAASSRRRSTRRRPPRCAASSRSSARTTHTASASCASWSDYPVRVWGPGWRRADPRIAPRVAGGFVDGPREARRSTAARRCR